MPEFKIYKSEQGVRMENVQLKRELEALRADNARLRALAGEPELAQSATLAPVRPAVGESFTAGNCTVSIGAPGGGVPPVNPSVVAARPRVTRPPLAARAIPAPVQQAQQAGAVGVPVEATAEEDGAILRFSMMEMG